MPSVAQGEGRAGRPFVGVRITRHDRRGIISSLWPASTARAQMQMAFPTSFVKYDFFQYPKARNTPSPRSRNIEGSPWSYSVDQEVVHPPCLPSPSPSRQFKNAAYLIFVTLIRLLPFLVFAP